MTVVSACQFERLMLILVIAFTLLLRGEIRLGLYEIVGQNIYEDSGVRFLDLVKY